MNTGIPRLIGFILLCLFQWYILVSWIFREENTMANGVFIKIPCQQIDPKDPFRGTYLQINPFPAQFEFADSNQYTSKQLIWVNYSQVDGDRYAFHSIQPIDQTPSLPIHIQSQIKYVYPIYPDSLFSATIEYPFSNFYVNEKAALPLLERYNKALSDTTLTVYAGLYVLDGKVSLQGLWIGDQKLE